MAIIFMDGAEKNSLNQWTTVSGATAYSSSGLNMSGSYVIECTSSPDYLSKTLPSSYSELYLTFRYRITADSGLRNIVQFYDSSGVTIAALCRNSTTGLLELYLRRAAGTVLATGSKAISAGTTYQIKVHYKPLNSGGIIAVYVDDFVTADATYTGDVTYGSENVQTIRLGYCDAGTYAYGYCYFDDIIVSTTDISQNLRIAGKAVTGAGTTTQWDPSTGSNYQCVDEIPPSSTDYNSTNVTGEIDTFALADCTESINSIAALQVEFNAAYEGSPTPTHVQAAVRSGGTNYFSSDFSPPSAFGAPHVNIWATNPADSAAWEEADINALEIGYKAVA